MKVSLADIAFCFEGIVPAVVATCSKDGIPNASYLSHVFMVDEQHVATSFQFFNKTRANLLENPYAMIKVRNPINLQSYQLKLKYLRSEESGPVFENMSIKLDVIAAHEGMGNLFQLKAADIYEVIEAQATTTDTTFDPSHVVQDQVTLKDLELLRVISDKINELTSLEDVFDQSMQILNRYLGWTHMILLLAEPDQRTLITHSSFGYPVGGVGAEVKLGEGLIGICGQHRRVLQVGAIGESLRYAKAIKQGAAEKDLIAKISLPGLVNPASQIAAPLMLQNEFMGVFMIESETQNFWGLKGKLVLSTIANILALAIR
ncbi:MAG TPA: pyridoxamine 5'-phosphate oxidase family protein, partial [Bdellovibrio sp.]